MSQTFSEGKLRPTLHSNTKITFCVQLINVLFMMYIYAQGNDYIYGVTIAPIFQSESSTQNLVSL